MQAMANEVFKKGDKLRCVRGHGNIFGGTLLTEGKVYEVLGRNIPGYPADYFFPLIVNDGGKEMALSSWCASRFELVGAQ